MSNSDALQRDEFFGALLGDFLDESGQLLDRLNANLLELDQWVRELTPGDDRPCSPDLLNEMFRSAHSLKGLSAMLGLNDINQLTHKVENVFDAARKHELNVTADVVEIVFQAFDRLSGLVERLKDPAAEEVECESIIAQIGTMLRSAGAERVQTNQADAERALAQAVADETAPAPAPEPAAELPAPPAPAPAAAADEEPMTAVTPLAPPAGEPSPDDLFSRLIDDAQVPTKYLAIFIDETELSLDSLTETLLAQEGAGSAAAIESLLVIAHRIKGSAASIGLNRATKLAHLMEDQLQTLLDGHAALSPEMADALLRCSDGLRQYVQGLRQGISVTAQFSELARALLAAHTSVAPPPVAAAAVPSPAVARVVDAEFKARTLAVVAEHDRVVFGQVIFQSHLTLASLKARLILEKLSNLGELVCFEPEVETLDEVEQLSDLRFALVSEKSLTTVRQQLRLGGVEQVVLEESEQRASAARPAVAPPAPAPTAAVEVKPAPAVDAGSQPVAGPAAKPAEKPAEKPADKAAGAASDNGSRPTETLRVDIERLDQLMNLAGQLVINKARFAQIGDNLKGALQHRQSAAVLNHTFGLLERLVRPVDVQSGAEMEAELEAYRGVARRIQSDLEVLRHDLASLDRVRGSVGNLLEAVHQLDRVTEGIQRNVMDTRMVPIGPLFTRFKRVIRDITRANGKLINLVINGEKTELDKRMIDELGDPLIHMVRNSADHGIEAPEVRTAAGKPAEGTVTLNAFHRGNSIIIQVCDDGKGLDAERIRRKAVEKGLLSEADAEKLTRQQAYQLIWEPGLSTAEKITEVSGRGMGMDIVKSKIEDLHGSVELDSAPGQGTTITVKLPLTLAILPSLMAKIDGDVFALPLEAVAEIVAVNNRDFNTVHRKLTACVRGQVISVVRLQDLFHWNRKPAPTASAGDETTLVILGEQGRQVGLAVDVVLGEEDVVIKSMAENFRNVPGIAGASILGDGRVSLILDVATVIDMASTRTGGVRAECPPVLAS